MEGDIFFLEMYLSVEWVFPLLDTRFDSLIIFFILSTRREIEVREIII